MSSFKKSFSFLEKNEPKQIVSGVIYPADFVDSQNDFARPEDLEKAVIHLASNPNMPAVIDVQHSLQATDSILVESYIAKAGGEGFMRNDWLGSVKVSDKEWPLVESGKLGAFSIHGKAMRQPITKNGKTITRMLNMETDFVSLVARGANQHRFVSKGEQAPAWFAKFEAEMEKRLERIKAKMSKTYQKAENGDYVKRNGQWYKVLNAKTDTLQVMDQATSYELEKQYNAKVRKESGITEAHADYVAALHEIGAGDNSLATRAKILGLQEKIERSGGADAAWGDLLPPIGGDAYAWRNRRR